MVGKPIQFLFSSCRNHKWTNSMSTITWPLIISYFPFYFQIFDGPALFFRLCSTYPKLHIVPAMITDKDIEAVAKFRTSHRFPSVVWR